MNNYKFSYLTMASLEQVKEYIAYWFQLGKKVRFDNTDEEIYTTSVIEGDRYSVDFERCWQRLKEVGFNHSYLENTSQTIAQLLTPVWDLEPCARCGIKVPIINLGVTDNNCTCSDLDNWPNNELPAPRLPVSNTYILKGIQERLQGKHS